MTIILVVSLVATLVAAGSFVALALGLCFIIGCAFASIVLNEVFSFWHQAYFVKKFGCMLLNVERKSLEFL